MKNLILLIVSLLALSGCASMTENDCLLADWQAIGYQLGAQGKDTAMFNNYQRDCAKYQVQADFNAFQRGHKLGVAAYCTYGQGMSLASAGEDINTLCSVGRYPEFYNGYREGLKHYCVRENGYSDGKQGKRPNSNCSQELFPQYYAGYKHGEQYHELLREVSRLEDNLDKLEERINTINLTIKDLETILVSDSTSADQRKKALNEMRYYRKIRTPLEREYSETREELVVTKDRLDRLSYNTSGYSSI